MANMSDMARMMAAGGGMAMEGGPEASPGPEAPMDDLAGAGSDPMADLMGAVDAIEAAAAALPEEVAGKLRQHIEALRAIAAEGGGEAQAPAGGEAPPPAGVEDGAMVEGDVSGV